MGSSVDTLAERSGIESEFEDALGQKQETPPEKRQALLKAMNLGAEDDSQANAAMEELDRQEWMAVLPPVVVLYAEREAAVPVTLPQGQGRVRWALTLEGGEERSGEADFAALELLDRHALDGKALERRALVLPEGLPWGYHRLALAEVEGAETSLIVTPGRCWVPEARGQEAPSSPQGLKPRSGEGEIGTAEAVPLRDDSGSAGEGGRAEAVPLRNESGSAGEGGGAEAVPLRNESGSAGEGGRAEAVPLRNESGSAGEGGGRRFWGIAAQMYLLRSERNWGIGDFTDLRRLVEIAREQGADAIGVNPLHGMFLDQPEQASPYSPLSRYLLNALNIDVEAIPEFAASEQARSMFGAAEFQETVEACRAAKMVDYKGVASLKLPVLQVVFSEFERGASEERKEQFRAFLHGCDDLLRTGCTYEAIRQFMTEQSPEFRDCGKWPEEFRHSDSEGVRRFQHTHAELVRYHLWLQWVADQQLEAVKKAAEGMAVGIYRDLAVGANPSGAEVWSNPEVMVSTAEVGAPPDEWNAAGQNWTLPPFHPKKMREEGYRSFIALVRTNMRHAGGLRIDHAMSLQRLYWIPRGGKPEGGGYVRYPTDDLIGVLALESHRNRCLVVGEDLGTVAPGFRERMAEANILSYRVLLLEKDKKGYVEGSKYPRLALSTASSHDLPTLRGWWEGVDLELKERIGLAKDEAARKAREERRKDRQTVVEMFRRDGVLEGEGEPRAEEFIDAAHRFLARTPALLMMAQIEDIVEEPEQVNLPATMPDQYPSWSRRVAVTLEDLAEDKRLLKLARIVNEERGRKQG